MRSDFDKCLKFTLVHEGGYSNHPLDPGGATMKGVTQRTYDAYRKSVNLAIQDVRKISDDELKALYRRDYWNAVHGDDLPSGVSLAVFDFAVNSGPGRAIPSLQRAIGVADDGAFGPVTLANALSRDAAQTIDRICADRMTFLRRLTTWQTFGKGWTSRVEGVRAEALAMAKVAVPTVSVDTKPLPAPVAPPPSVTPPTQPVPVKGFWATILDNLRASYPPKG